MTCSYWLQTSRASSEIDASTRSAPVASISTLRGGWYDVIRVGPLMAAANIVPIASMSEEPPPRLDRAPVVCRLTKGETTHWRSFSQ